MENQRELLFLNSIIEKENHTIFLEVNFGNIKFINIKELKVFNKNYPISDCAYLSINNQIKVKGRGFQDLSDDIVVNIYNQILNSNRLKEKKANVILVDNFVKAITVGGDDRRAFKYTRTSFLIRIIKERLSELGYGSEFVSGVDDDCLTVIRYKIPNIYHYAYNAAIDIITSISSYSSIKIVPVFYSLSSEIVLNDYKLSFENKGTPLIRIKEQINEVIETLESQLLNFKTLKDKDIEIETILEICSNIGVDKNVVNLIKNHYKGNNVYDFINFMQEFDYKNKEFILGKILNEIRWERFVLQKSKK